MIAKIISSKFLWLAVAGAVGTLSRYGLGGVADRVFGQGAGWGTLAVNAVGCFLAGAVWILAGERGHLSPEMRAVILVGFMGVSPWGALDSRRAASRLAERLRHIGILHRRLRRANILRGRRQFSVGRNVCHGGTRPAVL